MMPIAVFEALAADSILNGLGITADTIFEMQAVNQDTRPANTYFLVINFQENDPFYAKITNTPRVMDVAVHVPWDITREYNTVTAILNRIQAVLAPMEQVTGTDGVRVTCVRPRGRSGNAQDPGWQTTTRHATFGVLYDESAA